MHWIERDGQQLPRAGRRPRRARLLQHLRRLGRPAAAARRVAAQTTTRSSAGRRTPTCSTSEEEASLRGALRCAERKPSWPTRARLRSRARAPPCSTRPTPALWPTSARRSAPPRRACGSSRAPSPAWRVDAARRIELPLLRVAWAAGELLTSGELDRVKACPGDECGWLFLDRSGRRRWCSMDSCGNRAKVRAHAARHR